MHKIKEYRYRAGLSGAALAKAASVSQPTIWEYETKGAMPSLYICRDIVQALNSHGVACTLDDVFPPRSDK